MPSGCFLHIGIVMSTSAPAPWKIKAPRDDKRNGGQSVMLVGGDGTWIGDLRKDDAADDANIALILAAKDLVESLTEMEAYVVAILKATGEKR